MKYLIAGLGNVGSEYAETRHNIGFKIVDALSRASAVSFKTERYGDVCKVKHRGRTLILLKPNTYMNLSGKAVNYWMTQEKISIDRLLVVTDDLALPFGKQRMRLKGSDGGHNGLKDINAVLGSNEYARLRFGVGNTFDKGRQVDYVLGNWNEEELLTLENRIKIACDTIQAFTTLGGARAMSQFNNK
jgi:PTH1 family peptidyl-tRNA hydrolase